jgi:hypothetical protein
MAAQPQAKAEESSPFSQIAYAVGALIVLFYAAIAHIPKPEPPIVPRKFFTYERGLNDAFTKTKSEPVKREIPIIILEGRFEPHFVFKQLSYDDLGKETMFKCSACSAIQTLSSHAHSFQPPLA